MSAEVRSFTGRTRKRRTSLRVQVVDRLAKSLITAGGMGTIAALLLVFFFLLWVAIPLFRPSQTAKALRAEQNVRAGSFLIADEYRMLAFLLSPSGLIRQVSLADGHLIREEPLLPGKGVTALSSNAGRETVVVGTADGSLQMGRFSFRSQWLNAGETQAEEGAVLSADGKRSQRLSWEWERPIFVGTGAIRLIDDSEASDGRKIAFYTEKRELFLWAGNQKYPVPFPAPLDQPARFLLLSGIGDNLYLGWDDGTVLRFDVRDPNQPKWVETRDLVEQPNARLTALSFLIGKTTLLAGDSEGMTRAWFRIKPPEAETSDGAVLVVGHTYPGPKSPVTAFGASLRSRVFAAGYADGSLRIIQSTSEKELARIQTEPPAAVRAIAFAPKEDSIFEATERTFYGHSLHLQHPEVSFRSLFTPVWYEGYTEPQHVWQSSSGTDDFEPKFGLIPLIFGTLKATFYSLLFGVPVAILAAIYTSEFLNRDMRARVKPAIELMASLPSVVLGFLAALVFAPAVETILPEILTAFIVLPLTFLFGAYFWQLLPYRWGLRLSSLRFLFVALFLPLALWLSAGLGPHFEMLLFHGDLRSWLDGQGKEALGGWLLLFIPVCGLACAVTIGQVVNPWFRRVTDRLDRPTLALAELLKICCATIVTIGLATLLAWSMELMGFDPRGSFLGTYVQRNSLVVGIVMGFAIIPIIYTLAEDALAAVPDHLRSASLGAGATPWQTTIRIVIPTAMSGLFAAVMIGLGRAVGETMIVLMAAGNTPILEWNIFNGFRTLSANIAVELPEAVRDSTHYRTLFLAALVLFCFTFILNTLAESVRLRFRKRAVQL